MFDEYSNDLVFSDGSCGDFSGDETEDNNFKDAAMGVFHCTWFCFKNDCTNWMVSRNKKDNKWLKALLQALFGFDGL